MFQETILLTAFHEEQVLMYFWPAVYLDIIGLCLLELNTFIEVGASFIHCGKLSTGHEWTEEHWALIQYKDVILTV